MENPLYPTRLKCGGGHRAHPTPESAVGVFWVIVEPGTSLGGTRVDQLRDWPAEIPKAWVNRSEKTARFKLVITGDRETAEYCRYRTSSGGIRNMLSERISAVVTLTDLADDSRVANQTFRGGRAPGCPSSIASNTVYLEGTPPDATEFAAWLIETLSPVDETLATITPTPVQTPTPTPTPGN